MFTVKASYSGETRKFIYDVNTFPTYTQISEQLLRVFTLKHSYYLSNLIFSPFEGSKVLIGVKVQDEEKYNACIAPYKRYARDGLLKFNVVDGKDRQDVLSNGFSQSKSLDNRSSTANDNAGAVVKSSVSSPPMACTSNSLEVQGKSEIKQLFDKFLQDFTNIMSNNFGEEMVLSSSSNIRQTLDAKVQAIKNDEAPSSLAMPGSFVQDHSNFPSADSSESVMKFVDGLWCSRCGLKINSSGSRCSKCLDYLLCDTCVSVQDNLRFHQEQYTSSKDHVFLPNSSSEFEAEMVHERNAELMNDVNTVIHIRVACNACGQIVVGERHKCLDCRDYDLCDDCFPIAIAAHTGSHRFQVIDNCDVGQQLYSSNAVSIERDAVGQEFWHSISCNLCDSTIRGDRYKCVNCPDFDVCSSCLTIAPDQHPRHIFVRISSPSDIVGNVSAIQVRHPATCDECNQVIYGIRFKCSHPTCPDFDLCEACESLPIPVHPETHTMLKIRKPWSFVYRAPLKGAIANAQNQGSSDRVIAVATSEIIKSEAESAVQTWKVETTDVAVSTVEENKLVDRDEKDRQPIVVPDVASKFSQAPSTEDQYLGPVTLPNEAQLMSYSMDTPESLNGMHFFDNSHPIVDSKHDSESFNPADVPVSLFTKFPVVPSSYSPNNFKATFIKDNNIEDGQIIPPGTQFLKSWRMRNDGDVAWPESTHIVFVAGDRMPCSEKHKNEYLVGVVQPGTYVDIIARDMTAPDMPGRYIGYWRLRAGSLSQLFGQSVWCEIVVSETLLLDDAAQDLLSSSTVIMPKASDDGVSDVVDIDTRLSDNLKPPLTPDHYYGPSQSRLNTKEEDSDNHKPELSRADSPSDSDDNVVWEDLGSEIDQLSNSADIDYVVLYDDDSSSGDEA